MSSNYAKRRYEQQEICKLEKAFMLSSFINSDCFLITRRYTEGIEQIFIKRRELIQYVANKLGGHILILNVIQ